jgi:hypothetical protein
MSDWARVSKHLAHFGENSPNDVMLDRIKRAVSEGRPLSERQVYFMRHELTEAALMDRGVSYEEAHAEALKTHPPGQNYDLDVIDRFEEFGPWWRRTNGLDPR